MLKKRRHQDLDEAPIFKINKQNIPKKFRGGDLFTITSSTNQIIYTEIASIEEIDAVIFHILFCI